MNLINNDIVIAAEYNIWSIILKKTHYFFDQYFAMSLNIRIGYLSVS